MSTGTEPRLTQAQELWLQGFIFAVSEYAVWHDGEQFVGVMRRPIGDVIEEQRLRLLSEDFVRYSPASAQ